MIVWLAIFVVILLIRGFIWLCGRLFGSATPGQPAYPGYGGFDVLVYQASPYGGGAWTLCRRHADYYATLQDVEHLRAWGYQATFVQR